MNEIKRITYTKNETIGLMKLIKSHVHPSGYIPFSEILKHDKNEIIQKGRNSLSLSEKWKRLKATYKDTYGTVVNKNEIIRFCNNIIRLEEHDKGPSSRKTYVSSKEGCSSNQNRKKWDKVEIAALNLGYKKHGHKFNKWHLILKEFRSQFQNRTTVNLKDKWRNILKKEKRLREKNNLVTSNYSPKVNKDADCDENGYSYNEENGCNSDDDLVGSTTYITSASCKLEVHWPKPYFQHEKGALYFENEWDVTIDDILYFMRHDLKSYHKEKFPDTFVNCNPNIKWRMVLKEKQVGNHQTLLGHNTLRSIYQKATTMHDETLRLEVRPPKEWLVM